MPEPIFRTGMLIPSSGIYQVVHSAHRLPHEVTLLKGETFPKCQKCHEEVTFHLLGALDYSTVVRDFSWRITLYELPVLEDEGTSTQTAS
jgi:hypothetical protein